MSERSSRGNEAEVAASARLDKKAAARFIAHREATLVENAERKMRRESCLRDSALVGGGAGLIGGSLALQQLRSKAQTTLAQAAGQPRFWQLLGIKVSGQAIGGAGQAFVVFVGFFMPFSFVSNVCRWRCQKAGLKLNEAPKAADYAQ